MPTSGWGHGDNLSFEKFHALVGGEDARLAHGVVFLTGEEALLRRMGLVIGPGSRERLGCHRCLTIGWWVCAYIGTDVGLCDYSTGSYPTNVGL